MAILDYLPKVSIAAPISGSGEYCFADDDVAPNGP
jgi:hypothetical protein